MRFTDTEDYFVSEASVYHLFLRPASEKQVGLLHELVLKTAVFGVLVNPNNPRAQADATSVEAAVRTLKGETPAFETLSRRHAAAIVITSVPAA